MFTLKKKKLIHKETKSIINSNFSFLTGIDILTNNAFVIIKFKNLCGDLIECTMSISDFENPKTLQKTLKNKGFTFTKDTSIDAALVNWLSAHKFKTTYSLTSQTGWYKKDGKYAYVLPNKIFGKDLKVRFLSTKQFAKKIKTEGNWKEYKEVLKVAECSPVIIFTVGVGLAAFLIEPLDLELFGIHLFHDSTAGKTTALKFPTTFFSSSKDFTTWYGTRNGIESLSMQHNSRPLILDELKMISSDDKVLCKVVTDVTYSLCNGRAKKRHESWEEANDYAEKQSQFTFISNGEFSIINKAQECGYMKDKGEFIRLIDVPACINPQYGIFSYLPEPFKTSEQLALHIENVLNKNYGFMGRKYAKKLTEKLNSKKIGDFIQSCVDYIYDETAQLTIPQATGYTKRYTRRFATAELALNLASEWGLVPWSKETIHSAIELMYAKSVECIETDEQLLARGVEILRNKLTSKAPDCLNLQEDNFAETQIKSEIKKGKYFLDKVDGKWQWFIPSATFKSWFKSEQVYQLIIDYLADLLPTKTKEGYPLVFIGKHRARAIVLRKKKLKELLSKK